MKKKAVINKNRQLLAEETYDKYCRGKAMAQVADMLAMNKKGQLERLNRMVSRFIPENLKGKNASQMVRDGRELLNNF